MFSSTSVIVSQVEMDWKREFDVHWASSSTANNMWLLWRRTCVTVSLQLALELCLEITMTVWSQHFTLKEGRNLTKSFRWIFYSRKVGVQLLLQIGWLKCVGSFGLFLLSANSYDVALNIFEQRSGCSWRGYFKNCLILFFFFFFH